MGARRMRMPLVTAALVALLSATVAPVAAEPEVAGPEVAEPGEAEPGVVEPEEAEPEEAEPGVVEPEKVEPDEVRGTGATDTVAGTAVAPPADGFAVRPAVRAVGDPRPEVLFRGSGWGHGVGMSQYGAQAMARAGHAADEILQHYYPGTAVAQRPATMPVRVGLRQLHDAPFVRAVGGAVTWHACPAPADPTRRTHDDLCTALTTQPAGTTYHVCQAGTSQRVQTVACGAAGGTVVASATQPILRVHHHGVQIEAPGPNAARCQSDVRDGVGCYRWSAHDIVNVAPGRWNTVQYLRNLQQYLHGLAEMPASWNAAALQAQAIAGRTFALRTIGFRATCSCEILATPAHQAYGGHRTETASGGAWPRAVDATFAGGSGSVLTYDGALAQTFYSSSHGGRTEAVEDSWAYANNPVPYLRSVDDPWSLAEPHNFRSWTSSATNAAVAAHVSSGRSAALSRVERVQILSRTSGGTPREVRVSGVTAAGMPDTFVFTSRAADSPTLQAKRVAGASFRMHLPTTGHPTAAGSRLPSSQIAAIGFAPFTDDDGTTHEYAITWTALAGIAQGVGGARFAPGRDVTRGQMATFLYQTFAIPAPSVRGRFPDVADPDATHALAIDALAQAGVAGGFTDGMFRPGAPVTRAQMATFLTAAAGLRAPAGTADPFVDVRRQAAHGEAIAAVAAAGVAAGCTADGSGYCPGDPVSRGQMASFLRRVATR